jgi:Fe-S cluster assembly protein SufD
MSLIVKSEAGKVTGDAYLETLLKQCQGQEMNGWWRELRQLAASWVEQSKIPSKKDEDWRFTDLSELLQFNFQLAPKATVTPDLLVGLGLPECDRARIVFVNGVYTPELSDVSGLPAGVWVGNLSQLPASYQPKVGQYLAQHEGAQEVFTALNTSGLTDVAIIWVNQHVGNVETPIHLLFLTEPSEFPVFSQPRTLVIAETGSSLQLIEQYGIESQEINPHLCFTNAVTEIWLQENARVNHTRLQRESKIGFHIAKSAIAQFRDSSYTCNEIGLGAKLYRHDLQIWQKGEQTETKLNGLIAIGGEQLADTHSLISLTKPYGSVAQLHKCIVSEVARAVFNGKIVVPKAAQFTNATQLNRNLLLSPKARVNTKPELQITADNVKCSHGATVSQLEADEIFYLQSRGLREADARNLLIDAFAAEIIERIPVASMKIRLAQCVACKTIS